MVHRILGSITALAMMVAAVSAAAPPLIKKPLTALQKSVLKKRTAAKPAAAKSTTWRNRQLQPTQERYKEIQQALASKGYLQPEQATGTWDQNSADALKQFQTAQNLDASGKINALSLIALGLGPRHDTTPAPPMPQPADPSR